MTFDLRTRFDGMSPPLDPVEFFEITLPSALAQASELLAPSLSHRPPDPLAIRVEDDGWTLRAECGVISITREVVEGMRCWHVERDELADLVYDRVTPNGLATRGTLMTNAPLATLLDWWMLLRGALDGTSPFVPGSILMRDVDGAELQLDRQFTLDDPPNDMCHFLSEAGFLRIRKVFTSSEMAVIASDMDRFAPHYSQSDGRSFWARHATGGMRLVRMQYFDTLSSRAADIACDERIQFIAGLTGQRYEPNVEAGLVEALFKPARMVGMMSDFPWHKDCSLGRHSYDCCSLTLGIAVTPGNRSRGLLRVVAGSHRALMWPVLEQPGVDLPVVDLSCGVGDVTMHLSCTMHMSQRPTRGERRVLYVGLRLPERDPKVAATARLQTGLRTIDWVRN